MAWAKPISETQRSGSSGYQSMRVIWNQYKTGYDTGTTQQWVYGIHNKFPYDAIERLLVFVNGMSDAAIRNAKQSGSSERCTPHSLNKNGSTIVRNLAWIWHHAAFALWRIHNSPLAYLRCAWTTLSQCQLYEETAICLGPCCIHHPLDDFGPGPAADRSHL